LDYFFEWNPKKAKRDSSGILLVVYHTFEEETQNSCRVRIFSARKAKRKEMKQYEGYDI
jgi:uncharacterized DUF497 family protein